MKNWISKIVGCIAVFTAITYMSVCDPLQYASVSEFTSWTSDLISSNEFGRSKSTSASRSKMVQQGGRFGRESSDTTSRVHQRNHHSILRAFRESVGDQWKTSVRIFSHGNQLALGSIVKEDGWIVTKASEIPDEVVQVSLFDGSKADGLVRARRTDLDLALLKIERTKLPVIAWNTKTEVPVGGWLASIDINKSPVSVGVMSVTNRNVPRSRALLGVTFESDSRQSSTAIVESVVEGSGADRAGIRTGDVIERIDGDRLKNREEVLRRLAGMLAGQRVLVGIQRNGASESLSAQMMDLNHSLLDPTEMEVNGEISARSTGFQKVMQHDSVLAPNECGGPVIDVYGNAVGINIARAGRVSSYAVSARAVVPVIEEMLASVASPNRQESAVVTAINVQSAPSQQSLPSSIPAGITIETLKPEIVVPSPNRR
jgi:serine protease Do